jgi:hypothetical protein
METDMPYFIYKITEPKKLEYVGENTAYKEARNQVRELRAQANGEYEAKMIFAKSQVEAERLLTEEREAPPIGDD